MKPEDKELLLKDLCGRLPYGVKVKYFEKTLTVDIISIEYGKLAFIENNAVCFFEDNLCEVKPYLRPMSSMTEEEQKEYHKTFRAEPYGNGYVYVESAKSFDWLNKNMFDFRELIPKDLALSTEEFNPYIEN